VVSLVVTDRDLLVLKFLVRWRFGTLEQLFKAGVFNGARITAYKRLLVLRRGNLIRSGQLGCGKLYYFLAPKGGELIGLVVPWFAKTYRNAGMDLVLKHLVACDFALAMGVDYLPRREVLSRWMDVNYDLLAKCFRGSDLFFENDGVLNVLVVDYQLSLKYLGNKVKLYAQLPLVIREHLVVTFLVFSEVRQRCVLRLKDGVSGLKVRALKGNWKY